MTPPCEGWCRQEGTGAYRSTKTASSHSGYRSLAGERRTCSTTKPHFWSTRRDARLLVAAVATRGRLATSWSSRCSARLAMPLPQHARRQHVLSTSHRNGRNLFIEQHRPERRVRVF